LNTGIWVILYLALTLLIGVFSTRFVKNSGDFMNASRKVPFMLSSFALFALWFGSETVFGATSEFIHHGLLGVIEDPFGGFLCLFLFALIFVKPLYRQNILTLGDLFRKAYGRRIEYASSLFMLITFFGYVAAQIIALSILFESVFGLDTNTGKLVSAAIVAIYTSAGGMWAVSITDFIQSIVIVAGLLFLSISLTQQVDFDSILTAPKPGFFDFFPNKTNQHSWLDYIAAWLTLGLGSLASQDIFQRANAAKSEKVAVRSTYFGAILYLLVAMLPLYLGLLALKIEPQMAMSNSQNALVDMVSLHAPFWLQVLFYGALISAIFSTCSGALLAPSAILAENLLKPILFSEASDKTFLYISRVSVIIIAAISTALAFQSDSIYHLVSQSSALGLVSILVPMVMALFHKNPSRVGAFLSMGLGLLSYGIFEYLITDTAVPTMFIGFSFSCIGMLVGMLLDRFYLHDTGQSDLELN